MDQKNRLLRKIAGALYRALPILLLLGFIAFVMGTDTPEKRAEREKKEAEESLAEAEAGVYPMSATGFFLDTVCSITIYEGGGQKALQDAQETLTRYDQLFDQSREGSDIFRINHRSGSGRIRIEGETAALLLYAQKFSRASEGDFDVTIGSLTALWDFQKRKKAPEKGDVLTALSERDPEGYEIDPDPEDQERGGIQADWILKGPEIFSEPEGEPCYFVSQREGIRIDVGAIAKGYIADLLAEEMKKEGVRSAVLNLGGNVLCIGKLPEGEDFVIGLRKPERYAEEDIADLSVSGLSVVTAGIYERYFEDGGVQYHHILSTEDGYPVQNELAAVTVVGPSSAVCDALSTTLFIKGTEEGLSFLQSLNESSGGEAQPYYAFFIGRNGSITASEGAESLVLKVKDGYTLTERNQNAAD